MEAEERARLPVAGGGAPASRGQTTAEFALTAGVFLLFILGIIDLSRAVYARNVLANAAREGARYAIVHSLETPGDIERVKEVTKALTIGLEQDAVTVDVSQAPAGFVQVTVCYTFHPVSVWMTRIVDGGSTVGLPLRGRSIMSSSIEE